MSKFAVDHLKYKGKPFMISSGCMVISDQQFTVNIRPTSDIAGRAYDLDCLKQYNELIGLFNFLKEPIEHNCIVTILRHNLRGKAGRLRSVIHGAVVTDEHLQILYKMNATSKWKSMAIVSEAVEMIKFEYGRGDSSNTISF